MWRVLSSVEITTCPSIDLETATAKFDIIIIDWNHIGPDVWNILKSGSAIVCVWEHRSGGVKVRLAPREEFTILDLPPMENHPARIADLYGALGWEIDTSVFRSSVTNQNIYFNPYGSTSKKSLHMNFASRLLDALLCATSGNGTVTVAPPPNARSTYDEEVFARMVKLFSGRIPGNIRYIEKASRFIEYADNIRMSQCVIAPDTSTQHVAGILGTPSITFYPSSTGYHHYFWGWRSANAWSLRTCESAFWDGLIEITCELLARIRGGLMSTTIPRADMLRELVDEFEGFSGMADRSEFYREGRARQLTELTEQIAALVPERWRIHIIPELIQIGEELSHPDLLSRVGADTIRRRVSNINSLKIIRKLCCI